MEPEEAPCRAAGAGGTPQKRRRSSDERGGAVGSKRSRPDGLGRSHAEKVTTSIKSAADAMRHRMGGSVSDPLNLEGSPESERASHSPEADTSCPAHLPAYLRRDPLNLEGRPHRGRGRGERWRGGGRGERRRQRQTSMSAGEKEAASGEPIAFNPKRAQFRYGNYDRYYGYRQSGERDARLDLLEPSWLEGKEVLDIGCNTGQLTLRIAEDFSPHRVVGVDIDPKLIRMAWRNLHRCSVPQSSCDGRPFPASLASWGPVPPPARPDGQSGEQFPHNVTFVQGNYVPEDEAAVMAQGPEYDVILAFSLTKWVHLNWGDSGLKRMFRKMHRQLRLGGRLVLEPQPFSSYARKKRIHPIIFEHYSSIQFFPDQFHEYLMSSEVGFSSHSFVGTPQHKSKGFCRPLHVYVKNNSSQPTAEMKYDSCDDMVWEGDGGDGVKGERVESDGVEGNGDGVEGGGVEGGSGDGVEGDGGDGVEGDGVEGNTGDGVEGDGGDGGDGVEGDGGDGVEGDGVQGDGVEGDGGDGVEGDGVEGDGGDGVEGDGVEGDGGDGVEGDGGDGVEGDGVQGDGVEGDSGDGDPSRRQANSSQVMDTHST